MKKTVLIFCTLFILSFAGAQVRSIEEADNLYYGREFAAAAKHFEKIIAQHKKQDHELVYKVAECYRNLKNYPKAAELYESLMGHKHLPVEIYLHYGQTLLYLSRPAEAKVMFEKFTAHGGKHPGIETYMSSCDFAMQKNLLNPSYSAKATNLVTDGLYLGGFWYNDGLVYSVPNYKVDEKTGVSYPQYRLVYRKFQDGKFTERSDFAGGLSSNFYLTGSAISPDGLFMYITRNNSESRFSKKKKFAKEGISHKGLNTLDIFMCRRNADSWSAPEELEINDPEYSNIHPCISADGNYMVFASNKPGGLGGYDLYIAEHHGDGWSNPQHMEDIINSPDDEMFPYLLNDTTLYFSSNGFVGLGGADIYVSYKRNGHWTAPENLGKGINSARDDFGLFFTDPGRGFFASNRNTEPGKDEIFSFDRLIHYIEGVGEVMDRLYLSRIEGVEVDIYEGKKFIATLYTDRKGDFDYEKFNPDKLYTIHVKKAGYREQERVINPAKVDMKHLDFMLDPIIDKNTVLVFNDILFEYGKAEVIGDSRSILKRVTDLLLANPGAVVELSAHTDSRGSDKANLDLSQRRAQACVDLLIEGGIDPVMLVAKGYGESKLKNQCGNNVKCGDDEHAVNRRVEIKVLDIKESAVKKFQEE